MLKNYENSSLVETDKEIKPNINQINQTNLQITRYLI